MYIVEYAVWHLGPRNKVVFSALGRVLASLEALPADVQRRGRKCSVRDKKKTLYPLVS